MTTVRRIIKSYQSLDARQRAFLHAQLRPREVLTDIKVAEIRQALITEYNFADVAEDVVREFFPKPVPQAHRRRRKEEPVRVLIYRRCWPRTALAIS